MRTRITTSPTIPLLTGTQTVLNVNTGITDVYTGWNVAPYVPSDEQILDQLGHNRNNYCSHTKVIEERGLKSSSGYIFNFGVLRKYTFQYPGSLHKSWTYSGWPTLSLDATSWRTLSTRALRAMWPGVESQLSLLNFIFELPQVRDIPKLVPQLLALARKPGNKERKLSDLVQGIASTILTSEFGIRPLMQDITALWQHIRRTRLDYERLLKFEGVPLVSHYSTDLDVSPDSQSIYLDPNYGNNSVAPRHVRHYQSGIARYNATMRYSYRFNYFDKKVLRLLIELDNLGLNLNPRIIWDAIPWSFVVDYVLRVGDFLERFRIRNVEPLVTITGFCHSYKRKYSLSQTWELGHNRPEPHDVGFVSRRTVSTYIREQHIPDINTALQLSGLSSREVILSLSLFKTKRKRR